MGLPVPIEVKFDKEELEDQQRCKRQTDSLKMNKKKIITYILPD
jgi:hypothetical protein